MALTTAGVGLCRTVILVPAELECQRSASTTTPALGGLSSVAGSLTQTGRLDDDMVMIRLTLLVMMSGTGQLQAVEVLVRVETANTLVRSPRS